MGTTSVGWVATQPTRGGFFSDTFPDPFTYYFMVGHCLWSLVFATIGGVLTHALFAASASWGIAFWSCSRLGLVPS